LYTGQRWDAQAQLHYYGARFYDPKLASFLTLDPLQTYMSPYAYVAGNPINLIDPTGSEDDCPDWASVCISAGFDPTWDSFAGGSPFDPWAGAYDPFNENFQLGGGLLAGGSYGFSLGGSGSQAGASFDVETVQAVVNAGSFIPGINIPAGAVGGLISVYQRDYVGALLSFLAVLPIVGEEGAALKVSQSGKSCRRRRRPHAGFPIPQRGRSEKNSRA
jgi:RHS repeat-associated protein